MNDDDDEYGFDILAHVPGSKAVLHTALILHEGWEMDNRAWIVEMDDGSVAAFSTSHTGLRDWDLEHAKKHLELAEKSAASIRKALEMWPVVKPA